MALGGLTLVTGLEAIWFMSLAVGLVIAALLIEHVRVARGTYGGVA